MFFSNHFFLNMRTYFQNFVEIDCVVKKKVQNNNKKKSIENYFHKKVISRTSIFIFFNNFIFVYKLSFFIFIRILRYLRRWLIMIIFHYSQINTEMWKKSFSNFLRSHCVKILVIFEKKSWVLSKFLEDIIWTFWMTEQKKKRKALNDYNSIANARCHICKVYNHNNGPDNKWLRGTLYIFFWPRILRSWIFKMYPNPYYAIRKIERRKNEDSLLKITLWIPFIHYSIYRLYVFFYHTCWTLISVLYRVLCIV